MLIIASTLSCHARAPDAQQTATTALPTAETPAMTMQPLRAPADAGPPSAFPRCEPPPDGVPELTSYMGFEKSHPCWVPMIWSAPEWRPEKLIRPLHHHGSRLELDNIEQYPMLDSQRGRRLRFTLVLTSVEAWKVPDRYQWRSVYHASIQAICELGPR
jgi:hypothetical protein